MPKKVKSRDRMSTKQVQRATGVAILKGILKQYKSMCNWSNDDLIEIVKNMDKEEAEGTEYMQPHPTDDEDEENEEEEEDEEDEEEGDEGEDNKEEKIKKENVENDGKVGEGDELVPRPPFALRREKSTKSMG